MKDDKEGLSAKLASLDLKKKHGHSATASRDYGKGPDLKMQSLKGTFESTHKGGNTTAQKKSSQADKASEGNGVHKHKCFADSNVILTDSKEQTVDNSKDGSFCLQIMYTLDCRFWVFFCFSDSGHARITRKKWKSEICVYVYRECVAKYARVGVGSLLGRGSEDDGMSCKSFPETELKMADS
ncbi:hypothetical protein ACLOJK_015927 [Asimina triloba]